MTDLSEHDAQLLRSAQVALEDLATAFREKAQEKFRFGNPSWGDALSWAAKEADARAKALGSLRG